MKKSTKKVVVAVVRFVVKYVVPLVLGWLEGDSHAIQEVLSNIVL